MVGKTKPMNLGEQRWRDRVVALGCIACRIEGWYAPAEYHHVTDRGRRMGHEYGLPLCAHHHRGQNEMGIRPSRAEEMFGPALDRSKRAFTSRYGTEGELLEWVEELLDG